MKRLMIVCVALSGAAMGSASAHSCLTLEVRSEARAATTTEGVSVAMAEIQTFQVCNEGDPVLNATAGSLTVSVDGEAACTRTDVDPSFDPFGFGAGIHMTPEDEGDCAAGITWSSFDPNLPIAEESGPQDGGVGAAFGKTVLAEGDPGEGQLNGVRLHDELHGVADPSGLVFRKVVVIPSSD